MKIGRNDPCWCNSGKKYKHCHLDREKQKKIPVQSIIKEISKAKEKKCLHPKADRNVCTKIIKSHSIQRANILEKISRNQHVYSFSSEIGELKKNDGILKPKLMGINNASTFTGFCSYHDTETFKPIEANPIEVINEHIFLISYRALCREIYSKSFQSNIIPLIKEGDKGMDVGYQLAFQDFIESYQQGVNAGLNDLVESKKVYDNYLLAQNYNDVIYYAVEIEGTPDIVVSGQIYVEMDFRGIVLQTPEEIMDFSKILDRVSFSILMRESNGLIIFSCFKNEKKSIEFLKSIDTIADNYLSDAIVRFAFEYFENTYMSPNWWDGLADEIKNDLIKRMNDSVDFKQRLNNALINDGKSYVNWKIINRFKNFTYNKYI